ncbi:MAG: phosphoribosylanthranilate isomerase [Candidatus Marinimicrobia bacterium]|nr:phosphoribosylanthranilate isomerase [Candidatus Neomarinimicrobiota bacterium]
MIPVKICGITNLTDALFVVEQGASAIGFIFYEKSPRAITIQKAKSISEYIPDSIYRVGVFVNQSKFFIDQAVLDVPLTAVQLHGDESPEFCCQFDLPVFKAVRIQDRTSLSVLDDFNVDGFLLDTFSDSQYGGTGKPFDWSILKDTPSSIPIILSGGLNPDNIMVAVREVSPIAVDVNSGVESSPGQKDHAKITDLFNQLKNTETTGFHFG